MVSINAASGSVGSVVSTGESRMLACEHTRQQTHETQNTGQPAACTGCSECCPECFHSAVEAEFQRLEQENTELRHQRAELFQLLAFLTSKPERQAVKMLKQLRLSYQLTRMQRTKEVARSKADREDTTRKDTTRKEAVREEATRVEAALVEVAQSARMDNARFKEWFTEWPSGAEQLGQNSRPRSLKRKHTEDMQRAHRGRLCIEMLLNPSESESK